MTLWGNVACNRSKLRRTIHEGINIFQEHEMRWANVKRAVKKGEIIDLATHQFTYDVCGRAYLCDAGPFSHKKVTYY